MINNNVFHENSEQTHYLFMFNDTCLKNKDLTHNKRKQQSIYDKIIKSIFSL